MAEQNHRATTTAALIETARERLSEELWDYVIGAAETETTARRNRHGIDALALCPRVLRDVSQVDASGRLLDHRLRIPVFLAPLGNLELLDPRGAVPFVAAAARFGVPACVSAVSEPGLEAVAAGSASPKLTQLYIRGDRGWARELIDRVVAAGYDAIAITADLAVYGRRERQLRSGWLPPSQRAFGADEHAWQARLTWEWLAELRERARLPFMLKGIQTAQDALLAVEHGIEVIYVSNHGGRQLDHARPAIDTLVEVLDAVGDRAQVVVDGGFMRGTDVIKALALGASAVGIGRIAALAFAGGGEQGLLRLLELLEEEIQTTLALLGARNIGELDARMVAPAPVVSDASSPLRAAFPREGRDDWPN